jgi:regulator-associated protein of mTOR
MNPELPADLFTSCLTTPIKMALRWFVMQNQGKLAPRISMEMLDKIPGQFGDRRTMLGELNWIFTAITDTIAWNTLPRSLFQKLFRQDLLVASLFRNFLLAERVMRSYDCTPISAPQLPPTHQHPMWKAWDLAVDISLAQLPAILENGATYKASTFFEEQLTAFEVWLRFGDQHRPPPEQLPIVLQVLLSQAHRLRALDLLGRFLDLGPWAVNLALSVGIFPYVLKLLQASARELRPLLVSIWAKILSVDTSCQTDLIRDASHRYFLSVLQDDVMMPNHRTWAAFILASIVHNFRQGQQEAEQANMIAICLEHLNDPEPVLRQWTTIALGRVWDNYEQGRWRGARDNAPEKLFELLKDDVPEVRAAAVFALGTFVNSCDVRTEHANSLDRTIAVQLMKTAVEDGSSLVRTELVVALQHIVFAFEPNFINACRSFMEAEDQNKSSSSDTSYAQTLSPSSAASMMKSPSPSTGLRRTPSSIQSSCSSPALDRIGLSGNKSTGSLSSMSKLSSTLPYLGSDYDKVYRVYCALEFLSADPHHIVSSMAQVIVMYLRQRVKCKTEMSRPSLTLPAPLFTEAFSATSVPSSPAKDAAGDRRSTPPPSSDGLLSKPLMGGVTTIKEETSPTDSSAQKQAARCKSATKSKGPPPNSLTHPRLARGGSVGRHPSGQHNNQQQQQQHLLQTPPLVPVRQSQSANVSLLANSPLPRPELTTEFIPWSAKYFTKQLMRHECIECDCDHESLRHWSREWMFNRNAKVRSQAEQEYSLVRNRMAKIDSSFHMLNTTSVMRCQPNAASVVVFHPYDSMIVAAGRNIVSVWNPTLGSNGKMNFIELTAKGRMNVSSLEMINSHDEPVLLVGYDDGGVIVLRDFHQQKHMQMVAAWNGLRELEPQRRLQQLSPAASIIASTAPAKTTWCQANLTLAQATDSRYIRLWDAQREMRKSDLFTEDASGAVTSLHYTPSPSSNQLVGFLVGGFTSGSIRLFDDRDRSPVLKLDDLHGCPILDARLLDCSGQSLLVAGNAKGRVRVYDLRMPYQAIIKGKESTLEQNMSYMAIHPRCPLFASWAQQQQIVTIHTIDPVSGACQLLNQVKHHEEGMLTGLRLGPESGYLRFHPHLLQLAIASREGAVTVKGIRKTI